MGKKKVNSFEKQEINTSVKKFIIMIKLFVNMNILFKCKLLYPLVITCLGRFFILRGYWLL